MGDFSGIKNFDRYILTAKLNGEVEAQHETGVIGGLSALSVASREGQVNVVRKLLGKGAEVDHRDNCGRTPLRFAAAHGHNDTVQALLDAGADVNALCYVNNTSPLFIACQKGYYEIVYMLLHRGAQTETRDNLGRTALWYAAADGHTEVVWTLLGYGAQVDASDNSGCTALMIAASSGHKDTVCALLFLGANVNLQRNDGITAVSIAFEKGYTAIARMLLEKYAMTEHRNESNCSFLWFAVSEGHEDVVSALLSVGVNVNSQWSYGCRPSALSVACEKGYTAIVDMLLGKGAETERRDKLYGRTALWLAASNGHVNCIESLIRHGANVDAIDSHSGLSPVSAAAAKGHINAVKKLIEYNANFMYSEGECQDPLGVTACLRANAVKEIYELRMKSGSYNVNAVNCGANQPALIMAVHRGRCDIVNVIKNEAYIFEKNIDNMEAIDVAGYHGHLDIAEFLLSLNTPAKKLCLSYSYPNSDCRLNTALHLETDSQAMKLLLVNGADVEAKNVNGLRPIHYGVRTGRVELVELLIKHGANVDAADEYGNTPLHEAVCHGLEIVELLVKGGAKVNAQNIDGKTPLHIAVERQQFKTVERLLNMDSDVGLTDVWRNTPIHYMTSELLDVSGIADIIIRKILVDRSQHWLILNMVGMSASAHVKAWRNDVQTHKANTITERFYRSFYIGHQTLVMKPTVDFLDCQKNTLLHQVVGVYGQLKMFKVNTNVAKTVDLLVEHGVDINAQNQDGLTPLHVARGEEAIMACLKHANGDSLKITDKRGRNFWHLLFLKTTKISIKVKTRICSIILTRYWWSNQYDRHQYKQRVTCYMCAVDSFNRTPLHYACMNINPWIAEFSWLVDGLIKMYDSFWHNYDINIQDKFGRTAFHYAAMFGSSELINKLKLHRKVVNNIRDKYRKTSEDYVNIQQNYRMQVTFLRMMTYSEFIAKHSQEISACIQGCFFRNSHTIKEGNEQPHNLVLEFLAGYDVESYVLNTYNGCLFDYTYTKSVTFNWQQSTVTIAMFKAIKTFANKAIVYLASEITKRDPCFACTVTPIGSAHEETKIGCCDEFDYNFVLNKLSEICEVCYSRKSPPGFVLLKLKASSPVYDGFKDLFDENGILDTRAVKFKFEILAKQVLSDASFTDETGFEFIDPVLTDDLGLSRGNVSTKLNTRIKLRFTGAVNKCHVPHSISVDLVPALQINGWWPDGTQWPDDEREFYRKEGDCQIVFMQPQNKHPWIGWTQPHGFISFGPAESRLIRDSPQLVRAAYMVVKRMSKYFCQYEFFSSHVIKTAVLWCLHSSPEYLKKNSSLYNGRKDLLRLVQDILRRLLRFAAQDYVPSYFLPKCHQPVWLRERHLKQFHTHLYRQGMTYQDLFSLNKEQLRDNEVLRDIKALFTLSHFMYWTVLSDTDELGLFVPSDINPLPEVSSTDRACTCTFYCQHELTSRLWRLRE